MKPINYFLMFFNLTWVIRKRIEISNKSNKLILKKAMLIFDYQGKHEKILYSRNLSVEKL